jgi:hypothetical protein
MSTTIVGGIPLVYDPRFHSWDSWASLMVEAYAPQQLSIPSGEDAWKQWAQGLKAIDIFTNEAIPGPDGFDSWQDWTAALVNAINRSQNIS